MSEAIVVTCPDCDREAHIASGDVERAIAIVTDSRQRRIWGHGKRYAGRGGPRPRPPAGGRYTRVPEWQESFTRVAEAIVDAYARLSQGTEL